MKKSPLQEPVDKQKQAIKNETNISQCNEIGNSKNIINYPIVIPTNITPIQNKNVVDHPIITPTNIIENFTIVTPIQNKNVVDHPIITPTNVIENSTIVTPIQNKNVVDHPIVTPTNVIENSTIVTAIQNSNVLDNCDDIVIPTNIIENSTIQNTILNTIVKKKKQFTKQSDLQLPPGLDKIIGQMKVPMNGLENMMKLDDLAEQENFESESKFQKSLFSMKL